MKFEFLDFEICDKVATITLNRPDVLNAIHPPMANELSQAWKQVRDDEDIWMAVLTGSGERAFSAGSDLKWRSAQGEGVRDHNRREVLDLTKEGFQRGRDNWKPLIAAVNGYAVGGGLELVLGCDLVIAADHAKFGLPEVRRGLMADGTGIHRLMRRLPYNVAMELILTGEFIPALKAIDFGFVNEVVSMEKLGDTVESWIERIKKCAPLALRASKEAAVKGLDMPLIDAVSTIFPDSERLYQSIDFVEGPKAFAEKREPTWLGK